jgi:hypothetical protein
LSGAAAKDSSGNDIERLFSLPKKRINNLQIPDLVGNDTVSPMHQPDLKDNERILKDQTIYTSCGESLKSTWEDLIVGGEPVTVRYTVPKSEHFYCFAPSVFLKSFVERGHSKCD